MMTRVEQQAKRIRELLAENAELRDRVEALEDTLVAAIPPMAVADLTRTEMMLLGLLKGRPFVTKDQAMTVLYGDRIDEMPEEKIVDVFDCKIRRKVKGHGIEIETIWGQGWRLTPSSRAALEKLEAAA